VGQVNASLVAWRLARRFDGTSFISVGHGTISGRSVHLELNDLHPLAATGDMILSVDGQKLLGTLRRKDGEHPLVWHRKRAPCG